MNGAFEQMMGMGKIDEARRQLLDAQREATAMGSRWILWQILATLAQIEVDPAAAGHLRRQARVVVETIADNIDDNELKVSFLTLPRAQALTGEAG